MKRIKALDIEDERVACECICGKRVTFSLKEWFGPITLRPKDCGHLLDAEKDADFIEAKLRGTWRRLKAPAWTCYKEFAADVGIPPTSLHYFNLLEPTQPAGASNYEWTKRKPTVGYKIMYKGERMSLRQACKLAGVSYTSARIRMKKGVAWYGNKNWIRDFTKE